MSGPEGERMDETNDVKTSGLPKLDNLDQSNTVTDKVLPVATNFQTVDIENKFSQLTLEKEDQPKAEADILIEDSEAKNINEKLLNACKSNNTEAVKSLLGSGKIDVNESINGVYCLCVVAHDGYNEIAKILLEYGADANVINDVSSGIQSQQSRRQATSVETPLSLSIKYNHCDMSKLLIDYGADALFEGGFDRSPLQDAIRLGRHDALTYMCEVISDVNVVLSKFKKEIIRQCLVNDNKEALDLFIRMLWDPSGINSDIFVVIFNNLMLKNKVQSDETADCLHFIMECIPESKLKLYDLSIFIKFFLRIMSAQFLSISDERLILLLYRANLFFIVLKYMHHFNFESYLSDLDFAFMTIYDSIKDTGESKTQVFDFIMNFYENLIVMGYLNLTPPVIQTLTTLRHVMELQCIQNYLFYRATKPLKLKELCRIQIKNTLDTYKYSKLSKLKLEEHLIEYVYFLC
ncbi:hypothetical protein GJ496_001188 [Pomphorhynchus laevis]|nr:hypothetical protein GJ496_001188 [Pomphorhynchus laevis]